jgi:hypothetical protein
MRFLALVGLGCALAAVPRPRPEKILWGDLRPGPYAVGFRSLYQVDPTRWYDPDYPLDPHAIPVKKPRPIFIAYWYPARDHAARLLRFNDYLDSHAPGRETADFAKRLAAYNHGVACAEIAGKDSDDLTPDERTACYRLLTINTFAARDARPADGRFPLVVYHAGLGGSYEDNAVLCEYLASHGYIVITAAYSNADSTLLEINYDLATTAADNAWLMRFAHSLPFADTGRLAAVGHSFGAQASLAWHAAPNSPLDAVVVLDTTVEYGGLEWPGFAPLKLQLEAGRRSSSPAFVFAARRRNPQFETFDPYLKFAPRYEATVDHLDHNDFVLHGVLGKTLRIDRGKVEPARRNYDRVCEHVLKFLDGYVKHDRAALAWLEQRTQGVGLDESFQLRYKAPHPVPPTGRQIVSLLDRQGAEKTRALLQTMAADLDRDALLWAGKTLFNSHRRADAVTVFTWATELYPQSAQVHQALGDLLKAGHAAPHAKAAYTKALSLIADDPDLTDPERADAREEIQEALDALDKEY